MVSESSIDTLRRATRAWVGNDVCELGEGAEAVLLWAYGTTFVEAGTGPDGGVRMCAWLVLGARQGAAETPELLEIAAQLALGRIEIDSDGDVTLCHDFPPGTAAEPMEHDLRELCRQADRIDDLLCSRLGGIRSGDRLAHLIDAICRPPADA